MSQPAPRPAEPVLIREDRDGIATLTLNRGPQRNSLSEALMTALIDELAAIATDPSVRVVVLAANGPAFSAGHDLKELTAHRGDPDRGREFFRKIMQQCSTLMQAIVRQPKPVIARVHGIATAAGCQLVASCDLAIAVEEAKFATPGVNIGLFCSTPMVALSRNISHKHALQMLLTGDLIDAPTALRFGLINEHVSGEQLDVAVEALAVKIASKSRHTLAVGKAAYYRQAELPLDEAYAYAKGVMVHNLQARDAREGIDAFIDKRHPTWCHG